MKNDDGDQCVRLTGSSIDTMCTAENYTGVIQIIFVNSSSPPHIEPVAGT